MKLDNPSLAKVDYKLFLSAFASIYTGEVVKHSTQNAINLIDEAELLYKHNKYARANLLALLAVEEISKADLIYQHHHHNFNPTLCKDLIDHTVKFGFKDRIMGRKAAIVILDVKQVPCRKRQ